MNEAESHEAMLQPQEARVKHGRAGAAATNSASATSGAALQ